MQTKRNKLGFEMMLLPSMESFIPKDHYLRRLDNVLDLSFIHDIVSDNYCQTNGRPSIDPEVIIRLFLIQAMDGLVHVRDLMRQVQVNLAYRWFIGYRLDEKLPDHSTLSKALDRFGDEVFNELFERSITQCQKSGLIEGKVLHVDATTIRADIDKDRVNKPNSPDPDARYGHFPDGTLKPGYKQHTVADGYARVIVGLSVTPANSSEQNSAVELIDKTIKSLHTSPEVVCADSAYSVGKNCQSFEERGIRFVSPPRAVCTAYSLEYFTIEKFIYIEKEDLFICPAGKQLKQAGRFSTKKNRFKYRASAKDCGSCPLKQQCTQSPHRSLNVTSYHSSLVRLRADHKTESFKQLYKSRAPVIEGIFGEAKEWHGLRRSWRRGLSKMRIQSLLIASVMNFKRLGAVLLTLLSNRKQFYNYLEIIWSKLRSCFLQKLSVAIYS
jgi:transposase